MGKSTRNPRGMCIYYSCPTNRHLPPNHSCNAARDRKEGEVHQYLPRMKYESDKRLLHHAGMRIAREGDGADHKTNNQIDRDSHNQRYHIIADQLIGGRFLQRFHADIQQV